MESNEAKTGMKVEVMETRGSWKNCEILKGEVQKVLGPDTVLIKLDDGRMLKSDVERMREPVKV